MKYTLTSISNRWNVYSEAQSISLLKANAEGFILYQSMSTGEIISPDPNQITKLVNPKDNTLKISDAETFEVLMSDARPMWNYDKITNIINEVVLPINLFDSKTSLMVFDTNTHEILYSNSSRSTSQYCALSQTENIDNLTMDKLYESFKYNSDQNQNTLNLLTDKRNSNISPMTTLIEESECLTDFNDFIKYPLGSYNRIFQEKVIIPYENYGISGEPMQLTLVLGVQEKNILNYLNENLDNQNQLFEECKDLVELRIILVYINIIIVVFLVLVIMYDMKYIKWVVHKANSCNTDSKKKK